MSDNLFSGLPNLCGVENIAISFEERDSTIETDQNVAFEETCHLSTRQDSINLVQITSRLPLLAVLGFCEA